MNEPFNLAIDASRNRSGGAISHLIGLLGAAEPEAHGIRLVHVWSYKRLLDALPDRPWLVRHNPKALEGGLAAQLLWQRYRLPGEVRTAACAITLNCDAGTVATVRPAVTMSRDMLSYESGEMERYPWGRARLRLHLLRWVQNRSLTYGDGAIFLTHYAAETIQSFCGQIEEVAIIPHGVGEEFRDVAVRTAIDSRKDGLKCIYVSNAALHKHQWHVVEAIAKLREEGRDIGLVLAGGGNGLGAERLTATLASIDPDGRFVAWKPFLSHQDLARELAQADFFLFASSCENMPNTLVEGMASGLPIACSDRGPMPEVLRDAGLYFDPEDAISIAHAVRKLVGDPQLRRRLAQKSRLYAGEFTWARCANETFRFLANCLRASRGHSDRWQRNYLGGL